MIKNNGKGNLYLTKIDEVETKMWCVTDNHNYLCYVCAEGFLVWSLIKQLLTKYEIFSKLPQILHTLNHYFLSINKNR